MRIEDVRRMNPINLSGIFSNMQVSVMVSPIADVIRLRVSYEPLTGTNVKSEACVIPTNRLLGMTVDEVMEDVWSLCKRFVLRELATSLNHKFRRTE